MVKTIELVHDFFEEEVREKNFADELEFIVPVNSIYGIGEEGEKLCIEQDNYPYIRMLLAYEHIEEEIESSNQNTSATVGT